MMIKTFFFAGLIGLNFGGSLALAADPVFNYKDPIGRTLIYRENGANHLLGCFCIERDSAVTHDCKRSQFALGSSAEITHNFLGNTLSKWTPIGSTFDDESGKMFYDQTIGGELANSFQEIWKGIFNSRSSAWTGNSEPAKISKKAANEFINQVQKFFNAPASAAVTPVENILDKAIGTWMVTGVLNLKITKKRGIYSLNFYTLHDGWQVYGGTFFESDESLNASNNTFTFRGEDGTLNTIYVQEADGLVSLLCEVYTHRSREKAEETVIATRKVK